MRIDGSQLWVRGTSYDLALFSQLLLVAIGKAAVPMAEVALEVLEPALTGGRRLQGIVIGATLPAAPHSAVTFRLGSHPLPDEGSVAAADLVLDSLREADESTLVLFLISGGASAMVERPLDPGLPLADLRAFYQALVHSGLSITQMNALRKHLSGVKGGRLAVAAGAATQCTLLVSDVPPGQPDVIGSGLTMPDPTTIADCRALLRDTGLRAALPPRVRDFLQDPQAPETPKRDHPAFARAAWEILLSSDDLCTAAQAAAHRLGFRTAIDQTPDDWLYNKAAEYLLDRLQALASADPHTPVCLISAGEVAVPVALSQPGIGGRNQHFALHCAARLSGHPQALAVLSAGSDGADGNSPAAGAVVDGTTVARAHALGLEARAALAGYDSFSLLHAIGDALITGPTGNNLRDLRLLLSAPPDPAEDSAPASNP